MTSKLHIVYEPKPPAYKAVRVWLSDGSRMLGMWTGVKWWSTKGEIKPVKWELEERKKKKTEGFAKPLPGAKDRADYPAIGRGPSRPLDILHVKKPR